MSERKQKKYYLVVFRDNIVIYTSFNISVVLKQTQAREFGGGSVESRLRRQKTRAGHDLVYGWINVEVNDLADKSHGSTSKEGLREVCQDQVAEEMALAKTG